MIDITDDEIKAMSVYFDESSLAQESDPFVTSSAVSIDKMKGNQTCSSQQ